MNVYVYQAALICDRCAEAGEFRARLIAAGKTAEMDSDHWPHGPYSNGGGEADTPQHCDHCGEFLRNPLTPDGVLYVNTLCIPYMDETELAWSEIADRAEADGKAALAEWIRYYFAWGQ
jgi:hypothetical protein